MSHVAGGAAVKVQREHLKPADPYVKQFEGWGCELLGFISLCFEPSRPGTSLHLQDLAYLMPRYIYP